MNEWNYQPAADLQLAPLQRWRDYRRETGLVSSMARGVWWSGVKSWLRVWHRLEVTGRENLPGEPNFVLVANHCSHLDALALGSTLGLHLRNYLFPLAAGDVFFETPAMAAFSAGAFNALPVWRKGSGCGQAIKDLRRRLLEEPTIFVLFPEGTRARDGSMAEFKAGIGMLVAGTPFPVIPCHIDGAFRSLPPHSRLPRPCKLRVRIGRPRMFDDTKNRRVGWDEIASLLEQDVRQLADPTSVPQQVTAASRAVAPGSDDDSCSQS